MRKVISGAATEDKIQEFESPTMSACDTSVSSSSPGPGSSPSDVENSENVFLPSISIDIMQATGAMLHTKVNSTDMPLPPTLQGMREMLLLSEIADESHDIFFPKWTFTMYMLVKGEDQKDFIESVETDEHLVELLNRERFQSGTVSIKLEQCKNVKYSRFQSGNTRAVASPQYERSMIHSHGGLNRGQAGRGKFWKRNNGTSVQKQSVEGPIAPAESLKSNARMTPSNAQSSTVAAPFFYSHRQTDPRYQFWGDSDSMRGLVEYQAHCAQASDFDRYGAGMQYRVAPVTMPPYPVCYPGMGYWAFAPVSHCQHHGATFYFNYAPGMLPSANQQCF